jgi:hypothetical protein
MHPTCGSVKLPLQLTSGKLLSMAYNSGSENKKQPPALLTQFAHGYVHGTVLHLMSHRSLITLGCERFSSSKIYWVGSHCLKGVQPVDGQRYSTAIFYGWEVDAPVDAGLLLSSRNFGRLHGLSGITAIVFYTQRNLTRQMSFRLLGSAMSTSSDPLVFPAKHALYSGPDCIVHSNLLRRIGQRGWYVFWQHALGPNAPITLTRTNKNGPGWHSGLGPTHKCAFTIL